MAAARADPCRHLFRTGVPRRVLRDVGLRGFWMGYPFVGRAAPLGAVGPAVVTATFFNFHPEMVRRAIPDAWLFACYARRGRGVGPFARPSRRRHQLAEHRGDGHVTVLTEAGRRLHDEIEQRTDELAGQPFAALPPRTTSTSWYAAHGIGRRRSPCRVTFRTRTRWDSRRPTAKWPSEAGPLRGGSHSWGRPPGR